MVIVTRFVPESGFASGDRDTLMLEKHLAMRYASDAGVDLAIGEGVLALKPDYGKAELHVSKFPALVSVIIMRPNYHAQ